MEMLDDMAHDLIIFREYEWLFKSNPDLEETIVKSFLEMAKFWSHVIQYLKKHPAGRAFYLSRIALHILALMRAVNLALGPILDCQGEFETARQRIKKQTNRIKERAQARSLRRSQPEMLQELEEKFRAINLDQGANLPSDNLRLPPDPNFCGRGDVLKVLRQKLDHNPSKPEFQSFALYGIPGIGKTSAALVYAHERIAAGIQAVFWVSSETSPDIDKSFTDIAVNTLKLRGADENGNAKQNRNLVVTWLQQTSRYSSRIHAYFRQVDLGQGPRGYWCSTTWKTRSKLRLVGLHHVSARRSSLLVSRWLHVTLPATDISCLRLPKRRAPSSS
jgi:hypothetical protein